MNPEILTVMKTYLGGVPEPLVNIKTVGFDPATGLLDLDDLKSQLSSDIAAVFIENPTYLGVIETQAEEIGKLARDNGSEFIVFADPISLGVIAPPAHYGATIACGECHSLGIHMQAGGGQAGYIASLDDMEHASQFKDFVVSLVDTVEEGEYGFGVVMPMNLSYFSREEAKEYTGTSAGLWAITASVYLSLMGPKGMQDLGQSIMQKSQYAAKRISELDGVEIKLSSPFFKEFVVNFDKTGKSVGDINKALLKKKIFGGKDISDEFPNLGQSALYCVTEIMTKKDIDKLVKALAQATR
jgi:glycine dehydrogenase subunit 1